MRRNIGLAYIFSALFYFYLDEALWPIFFTDNRGLALLYLGIFEAAYVLAQLLCEIPSGILCDKFGKRRTFMIATSIAICGDLIILSTSSPLWIAIAFAIMGTSAALVSGTFEAFIYDSLKAQGKEHRYQKINSNIYMVTMITFSLALVLGGIVSLFDMRLMFVGNIIAELLALISCFFMMEPPSTEEQSEGIKNILSSSLKTIENNKLIIFLVAFMALTCSISSTSWEMGQALLSENDMTIIWISIAAAGTTLICGVSAKLGCALEGKIGLVKSSALIAAALVFPLIILGITKNLFVSIIMLTSVKITEGAVTTICSGYVNDEVDSSVRGTVLSIQYLIISLVSLVFAFAIGLTKNIGLSFIIIGILTIPAYIFIIYKISKNLSKRIKKRIHSFVKRGLSHMSIKVDSTDQISI